MDRENKPETLLGKILEYVIPTVGAVGVLAYGSLGLHRLNEFFDGPINVPGVRYAHAEHTYVPSLNIDPIYAGNSIDVTFNDGSHAIVIDPEGDFTLGERDSVTGSVPEGVDLSDVLKEIRRKTEDPNPPFMPGP